MGLPVGEVVGILLAGVVVVVALGKKLTSGNSKSVERDETINNPYNISGGRSRKNRQRKNKSRRR